MREDIFGGLKLAVSKGETLQQAMMSFYNAGYKKEDIEEAAKVLQAQMLHVGIQKPLQQKIEQTTQQMKPQKLQNTQIVSRYEQKPVKGGVYQGKSSEMMLVFILIFILIFFLGVLLTVLIFKQEVLSFFTDLFG